MRLRQRNGLGPRAQERSAYLDSEGASGSRGQPPNADMHALLDCSRQSSLLLAGTTGDRSLVRVPRGRFHFTS